MPMWGFGWLIPLVGLAICVAFMVMMIRAARGGGRFMCMGGHAHGGDDMADLRREVRELRDEVSRLKTAR
jgi:hypothetical protein